MTEIEWGYNCLTAGVHHGNPGKLWNMPLLYAVQLFSAEHLEALVVTRIYNDAMQFVEADAGTAEWAEATKQHAKERFRTTLQHTVGEISRFYKDPARQDSVARVVRLNQENKLSLAYEPLHGHDSLNMLCRILGTKCSRMASAEHGV